MKYEKNPEKIVDEYAIIAVIRSNLPAPLPNSVIPGAINPIISKGIINPKKLLKIELKVTNNLTDQSGKIKENTIPNAIANSTFGSSPSFFIIIS